MSEDALQMEFLFQPLVQKISLYLFSLLFLQNNPLAEVADMVLSGCGEEQSLGILDATVTFV